MERIYSYLTHPVRTIQLFNHQKDWRIWWGLIAIDSLISIIKVSNFHIMLFVSYAILCLGRLVLTSILIDATAQLLGQTSRLSSVLYWLGFANVILWLSPSATIIQYSFYSLGSVIIFILNLVTSVYIWQTIKKIYGVDRWKLIGLFIIPLASIGLFVVSIGVYITQLVIQ